MKLFLLGVIASAAAASEDESGYQIVDYEFDDATEDERSLEGTGLIADVSGMDLVLSTAINQAVSSTLVPVVGLAGGFARSAVAFCGSLSALKPDAMLPASFYGTVLSVIQGFADPVTGRVTTPVSMDAFLERLRLALAEQSVVDFDSFKRVVDNLKKIVILYPFVTTGAYLTYLSQVLSTMQAVLAATSLPHPTLMPATIPLAPHTHSLGTIPGAVIPAINISPTNLNPPNVGFTGALDGGILGQLVHAMDAVKNNELLAHLGGGFRPDIIMNAGPKLLGLNQLKSPVFTGINALGALNAIKASATGSLLSPIFHEDVQEEEAQGQNAEPSPDLWGPVPVEMGSDSFWDPNYLDVDISRTVDLDNAGGSHPVDHDIHRHTVVRPNIVNVGPAYSSAGVKPSSPTDQQHTTQGEVQNTQGLNTQGQNTQGQQYTTQGQLHNTQGQLHNTQSQLHTTTGADHTVGRTSLWNPATGLHLTYPTIPTWPTVAPQTVAATPAAPTTAPVVSLPPFHLLHRFQINPNNTALGPLLAAKAAFDNKIGQIMAPIVANYADQPILASHPWFVQHMLGHAVPNDQPAPTVKPYPPTTTKEVVAPVTQSGPIITAPNGSPYLHPLWAASHPGGLVHPSGLVHPGLAHPLASQLAVNGTTGYVHPLIGSHVGVAGSLHPLAAQMATNGTWVHPLAAAATGVNGFVPPVLMHPVHPAVAAIQSNIQANGGAIHPVMAARLNNGVTHPSLLRAQAMANALQLNEGDETPASESEEFIWSLPDASVYFLQRLDLMRPARMAPATFLQRINKTIQSIDASGALSLVTPRQFVLAVAEAVEEIKEELSEQQLINVSLRVDEALKGPFPPFPNILGHIHNVVSEKLGA
ncbi:hypothetical protein GNI_093460 [Gregarina niphandrodes]|uniref:Uncharacterized protein n=1 Tax=Gregarina niphandrodes TaxID=110365 RepID=A0A023B565_GRENI|nr:hypothetical protein GNI_093460 [Gregarina niphandrodes]EZG58893.1 hypothetical protein GNI_093460 [Gregarina niphandrodes]|eukprot:XP_011130924.1 hypothetical protein GNI_093460 [Gregarina niphandrodes]